MDVVGVVEAAVAEVAGRQHPPDQDQRGAGDLGGPYFLADVGKGAADDLLVGPGGAVDHGNRAVGTVDRRQFRLDVLQVADRQVDGEGGAALRQGRQVLPLRHGRGLHRRAGEDKGLADARQGEFALQRRRGGRVSRHAGHDLERNFSGAQTADLLGDGPIERRIAGMHPRHVLTHGVGFDDLMNDLVEGHGGRVHHQGVGPGEAHHLRRHQRAGIEHHRAARDQVAAPQGDQIGRPRPGADEIDRHAASSEELFALAA